MSEGSKKPQQPLSARLAGVGGITFGLLGGLVIGPQLFPKEPGQGFSIAQVLCVGIAGGVGAALGWLVRIFYYPGAKDRHGSPKHQRRDSSPKRQRRDPRSAVPALALRAAVTILLARVTFGGRLEIKLPSCNKLRGSPFQATGS
jgi:hypothetical protein